MKRFWDKVDRSGGPGTCWLWRGATINRGYGCIRIAGKLKLAHRVAVELSGRSIPDGMTVDHLCRQPLCVNPAHLDVVTMRVNVLRGDGPTATNALKNECLRGHAYTEENTIRTAKGRECRTCRTDRERKRARRDRRDYFREWYARKKQETRG